MYINWYACLKNQTALNIDTGFDSAFLDRLPQKLAQEYTIWALRLVSTWDIRHYYVYCDACGDRSTDLLRHLAGHRRKCILRLGRVLQVSSYLGVLVHVSISLYKTITKIFLTPLAKVVRMGVKSEDTPSPSDFPKCDGHCNISGIYLACTKIHSGTAAQAPFPPKTAGRYWLFASIIHNT